MGLPMVLYLILYPILSSQITPIWYPTILTKTSESNQWHSPAAQDTNISLSSLPKGLCG